MGFTLTPGGRTHRILVLLATRCRVGVGDLMAAGGVPPYASQGKRRKFWKLIDVLMDRKIIGRDPARDFLILPAGETALAELGALGPREPDQPSAAYVRMGDGQRYAVHRGEMASDGRV